MDRSLYIAMTGASQTLIAQSANANNLANTQTNGFKSDLEQFRSMPVFGDGYPTRVYAMTEKPATDFSPGPMLTTGNDLDIAIDGKGFFAIKDKDGKEAYTRSGTLKITESGELQTSSGMPVLSQNGDKMTIPPAAKLTIDPNGVVSILPFGVEGGATTVVGKMKLIKPDVKNIEKRLDGLVYIKDGSAQVDSPDVKMVQGVIEGSNVSAIGAMVKMIELTRNFELQTNVMKNVNQNAASSTKLLQLNA